MSRHPLVNRPIHPLFALAVSVFAGVACTEETVDARAAPNPSPGTPSRRETLAPLAGRLEIPAGSFSSGTEPGRFERQPELEPRITRTALGPFAIDTEPYPGGTGVSLLGLGRDQAAERCADRGGRLCTELEWERACKGPLSHPFPSGLEADPACATSPGCASGFGVWGMGSLREWTASIARSNLERSAIVRGAAGPQPGQRRCARRDMAAAGPQPDIGFRCCYGAPNAARVVLPRPGRSFARVELPLPELARCLAAEPATSALAGDIAWFDESTATAAVSRGGSREPGRVLFTSAPLAWNPSAGVDLLVVAARSGATRSFVVVLDALGDGSRRVASSFIMESEPGPVVLAYDPSVRAGLHFSTCWGCAGETGRILYHDPDRPLIVQP